MKHNLFGMYFICVFVYSYLVANRLKFYGPPPQQPWASWVAGSLKSSDLTQLRYVLRLEVPCSEHDCGPLTARAAETGHEPGYRSEPCMVATAIIFYCLFHTSLDLLASMTLSCRVYS